MKSSRRITGQALIGLLLIEFAAGCSLDLDVTPCGLDASSCDPEQIGDSGLTAAGEDCDVTQDDGSASQCMTGSN